MNKTDHIAFHNPTHIGQFDLGITQENKIIPFSTNEGVFIPESLVAIYCKKTLIKSYTLEEGLTVVGDNVSGQEKTLNLILNGSDFKDLHDYDALTARCTFFSPGDIDIEFLLKIEW